jgi:glycosyltransferase involved in cell wall biosynthesis
MIDGLRTRGEPESSAPPCVRILGTHGIPAAYGGFETAAENVARYLVHNGWRAIVYCQTDHQGSVYEDVWHGIERVNISVPNTGWLGTAKFDWLSIRHAIRHRDLCLTFGYNTGVFNILQRLKHIPNVINMDGIEWSRKRWGKPRQAILWINERIACWVGNELIADHPELNTYLRTRAPARKITTITYGADPVPDAPIEPVVELGLTPGEYFTLIARPIPENSILDLVRGFCARPRGVKLLVLGAYTPESDDYHRAVLAAASDDVVFPGAIYDSSAVTALRFHSLGYLHGHTVGGTNPSLVEALAAGNPVIAHDNKYNRWVAGGAALWFASAQDVDEAVTRLIDEPGLRRTLGANARARFQAEFTWDKVGGQYEALLRTALRNR